MFCKECYCQSNKGKPFLILFLFSFVPATLDHRAAQTLDARLLEIGHELANVVEGHAVVRHELAAACVLRNLCKIVS